ncbi:MAG: acetyl-CoA carboxylase biotin carboxylase subunit family protein [Planctomycetota bacterium]
MHVLFLNPDTHVYNHGFLRGLKDLGARISGIGPAPLQQLTPAARQLLDAYRSCPNMLDEAGLKRSAAEMAKPEFDRIETIDEPLVDPTAMLREHLGVAGLSLKIARLCRDKVAMKDFLREHDVPCALSERATSDADAMQFAERCGYPLIAKPIDGFGSLATYRCSNQEELSDALQRLKPSQQRPVALEEFIEGHEGFFDTLCGSDGIQHEFASHYYPGCLEATQNRWISPQIAVSNRLQEDGYAELREMNDRIVTALDLRNCATHMEWFFGPKGLKFGEIGARPAGEKIWDMYRVGNEFDVYREWALAIAGRAAEQTPTRRFAVGSIQIRPSKDGSYIGHRGLEEAWRRCGDAIYEYELPEIGTQTKGLERGWLVNTWFRLRHENYDQLRDMMQFLGETVRAEAK